MYKKAYECCTSKEVEQCKECPLRDFGETQLDCKTELLRKLKSITVWELKIDWATNDDQGCTTEIYATEKRAIKAMNFEIVQAMQDYGCFDEESGELESGWELEKGNVYAHFDCYQKGIGNGSCNEVATLDKYLIKNGAKYNCSLLFTPVMDIEAGIEEVLSETMTFNVEDGYIYCQGNINAGAELSIYDMGGVLHSTIRIAENCEGVALPVAGLPHGSYIIVVNNSNGKRIFKVVI